MRATSENGHVLASTAELTTVEGRPDEAGSRSRYCVFDLGDHQFGDLVYGGLGRTLVAFVRHDDASRPRVREVLEELGSDRLRCVLADPETCPTAAARLAAPGGPRYLLFRNGQHVDSFDTDATVAVLARLIAEACDVAGQ